MLPFAGSPAGSVAAEHGQAAHTEGFHDARGRGGVGLGVADGHFHRFHRDGEAKWR